MTYYSTCDSAPTSAQLHLKDKVPQQDMLSGAWKRLKPYSYYYAVGEFWDPLPVLEWDREKTKERRLVLLGNYEEHAVDKKRKEILSLLGAVDLPVGCLEIC